MQKPGFNGGSRRIVDAVVGIKQTRCWAYGMRGASEGSVRSS